MKMGNNSVHIESSSKVSEKSSRAFLTISEVSKELELSQHVLRFWETKFSFVKPMKRGGGRRYYRPKDVEYLKQIRNLLYLDGYTIKGVQKLLGNSGSKLLPEAVDIIRTQSTEKTKDDRFKDLHSILEELENIRDDLQKTDA
jgi:DNA-binding transcriptional MerR regulator